MPGFAPTSALSPPMVVRLSVLTLANSGRNWTAGGAPTRSQRIGERSAGLPVDLARSCRTPVTPSHPTRPDQPAVTSTQVHAAWLSLVRSFDRAGGEEDGRPRRSPDAALAPPPQPGPRQRRGPARRLRPPGREPAARSGSRTGRELSRCETAARRVRRRRRPVRVGAAAARGRASGGVRSATLANRSGRSGPHHRFPK